MRPNPGIIVQSTFDVHKKPMSLTRAFKDKQVIHARLKPCPAQ
jgi:hypothetical protein